ncbi:MAG: putative toxin-antitoxin system toxin component, PIN family [Candidatus Omnitrophota bacterium]
MIKVVLDTNVLIASIFWKGHCRQIVDLAIIEKIKSVTSVEILKEVETVLFEGFTETPYHKIEEVIRDILSYSELTTVDEITVKELRDLTDVKIIASALSAKVDYLITGDKDLLVLKSYKGITILTPKAFLNLLT